MIISLNELSADQVTYLRNKLSAYVKELSDEVATSKSRLATRIERSNKSEAKLQELEAALAKANITMTHLTDTNASAEIIGYQAESVEAREQELTEFKRKAGILSDENAVLEQFEINKIEAEIQFYQDKLNELEVLPLAS